MFLKFCVLIVSLKIVLSCNKHVPLEKNVTLRSHENDAVGSRSANLFSLDIPKNKWSTNNEKLKEEGRFLNKRQVVTCDGFILTIFRLTFKDGTPKPSKIPVLMVHGLYQSSDKFLKQSKNRSLAFHLQDLGYDVWLGNLRGNKYSRHHIHLEPEEEKEAFFNSTYEEMGVYDIAATVDFILNETNQKQLHYIGFSLGGTVFLVLNSLQPEYNKKFEAAHLMAPIGYQNSFPNSKLKDEAKKWSETYEHLVKLGIVEIFPYTNETTVFSPDECLGNETANVKTICENMNIMESMDLKSTDNKVHETRGGSVKQLAHIAQNIKAKNFSRWDYGESENEKRYGTIIPPLYNLSLVTVPTELIFSNGDELVSYKDVINMALNMNNGTARSVGQSDFKHNDYLTSPDAMEAVYNYIIKDMEVNSNSKIKVTAQDSRCQKFFWPTFIFLLIIILVLSYFLIRQCRRETELLDACNKSFQRACAFEK